MKITVEYEKLLAAKFGKLTVVRVTNERNSRYEMLLDCLCDCGGTYTVAYPKLKSGNTRSCGCLQPQIAREHGKANSSHGDSNSGTYASHRSMMRRCYDEKNVSYSLYGAKGVKVCDRWRGAENYPNFRSDMGERPKGTTLDRYPDNKGDYEPGNCRWATPAEQARNFTTNHWITVEGKTLIVADWAKLIGVTPTTILDRLNKGLSEVEAVSRTPDHRNIPKIFDVNGERKTIRELAMIYGIKASCLRARLLRGEGMSESLHPSNGAGRKGQRLTALGKCQSFKEWASETRIPYSVILDRLSRGWCPDDVVTLPVQKGHGKVKETGADF